MFMFYNMFLFNETATTEIYTYGQTLSLHDALPNSRRRQISPASATFTRNPSHAPPEIRTQVQPHQRPSPGDVREHGRVADQARADQDHAAQGQGTASRRRAADHAGQDRQRRQPPPRLLAPDLPRRRTPPAHRALPAFPHTPGRPPAQPPTP